MKFCEAKQGRTFILRLEDGDIVHESIEAFAKAHGIHSAALIILGGADVKSRLVVGPEQGRSEKIVPMIHELADVCEVSGVGTIFPDKDGHPVLHMHMACGRNDQTVTGCVRAGVKVWHVMEVVLFELTDNSATRLHDNITGFALLQPQT
ncbi:MAG: DNA-binding protein [Desulfobacterales bacterium]|jgi:predicted DNA-binding protein with PD1-like motif|nr:DNA-binding protein [Desulfobacterales bacterium]